MMNIEELRKANQMIAELTKNGHVQSFDDAVSQATSIYENSVPESYKRQETVVQELPKVEPQTKSVTEQEIRQIVSDAIMKNNKLIAEEMKKLYNEMQQIKAIKAQPVERPVEQVQQHASNQVSTENSGGKPQTQKESHPRQGNFSPDNVVLENYFYYGSK
ncbi:DUF2240 family protein [Candidatus Woesearchaeota archaeon]|nr:DUF2240 family protein [Candidatus Woesearchaeota archaeon]